MKAFGSLAYTTHSRDVLISGYAATVPYETFAATLTTKALSTRSDLILVPWSETGAVSEVPSLESAGAGKDPLANREFSKLTEDLFIAAEKVSSIGVYFDSSLFKTARFSSKKRTGTSIMPDDGEGNSVTYSSTNSGTTHLHVFYASTADDLFAVKLALQLAQNPAVHLSITQLAHPPTVSSEDGHVRDTSFNDLKAHAVSLAANPISFSNVAAATPSDEVLAGPTTSSDPGNVVFIVGRSVANRSRADFSRVKSSEVGQQTIGTIGAEIVSKIRVGVVGASLLVVQSKVESTGGSP